MPEERTTVGLFDVPVSNEEQESRSDDALRLVQRYAKALLDGVTLPERVDEESPEFFRLVDAFVDGKGSPRLKHLRDAASLFEGWGEDTLTEEDRVFLVRLLNETADVLRDRRRAPLPER